MTLRRLAMAGCLLATLAVATSACTVPTVPAEPTHPVYAPTNTTVITSPGLQPGRVVTAPAQQRTMPPGQGKKAALSPPGKGKATAPGQTRKLATASQQGPAKPKGKPADAPWKSDQPRAQAKKTSEPLPAAKGKPTPLVNKPPKGNEDQAETPAKQAREAPAETPAEAPEVSPGKGKGNGKGQANGKAKQPI